MKTKPTRFIPALLLFAALSSQLTATPAGTAFTYQGRLNSGGNPANGIYDLRFAIYDTEVSGAQVGPTLTNPTTVVSNGLFAVALDFGSVFDGNARWLEIAVRTNGGGAAFTPLAPRQSLTPTPYALYAPSAGTAAAANSVAAASISGTISLAQLPAAVMTNNATGATLTGNFFGNFGGSFFGTGSGLTGLSPTNLSSGTAAINISGNAATATTATTATNLIGNVTDAQLPANLARLNGTNSFTGTNTFAGVTLATNVNNVLVGRFTGNGAGLTNLSTAQFANAVLTNGQSGVTLSGTFSGNGVGLTSVNADQLDGQHGAFYQNADNLNAGTVPNARIAANVTRTNQVWLLNGNSGTTPGVNFIGTTDSQPLEFKTGGQRVLRLDVARNFLAGSPNNSSESSASSIAGGDGNSIGFNSWYAAIVGGQSNKMDSSYRAAIGGGGGNTLQNAADSVIAGGEGNSISLAQVSVIGGGINNVIDGFSIPDNYRNLFGCTIPGGWGNRVGGMYGFAAGIRAQANHDGSFVWADYDGLANSYFATTGTNQFLIRARGGVGINKNNPSAALDVNGTVRVNDNDLYLRGDSNHGMGWYGTGKLFAGANVNGPVLYGWDGGGLGIARDGGYAKLALTWTASGNVGIGTTTPDANLMISGSAYSAVESSFVGAHIKNTADGGDATLWLQNSTKNAYLRLKNNYDTTWLKLDDGTSTRMAIDLSGNVGIGKINPATTLDVNGTVTAGGLALSGPNYGDLKLRNDEFHGLGWYGAGKLFGGTDVNGPVLFGGSGGALGATGNGSVIALKWDNTGRVGVGTTTPQTRLHAQSAGADCSIRSETTSASAAGVLDVTAPGGTGAVFFGGSSYSAWGGPLSLNLLNVADGPIVFSHFVSGAGREQMRITSAGNVGIGSAAPAYKLDVGGDLHTSGDVWSEGWIWCNFADGWHRIDRAGATAFWNTSDERLKQDIAPIPNAVETLQKLRGVTWQWNGAGLQHLTRDIETSWKSTSGKPEDDQKLWADKHRETTAQLSKPQMGFIAQEVEQVFPDWVKTDEQGYKQVNMEHLGAVLVNAIKEQQTQLNAQRHELEQKNGELQSLKARLDRLEQLLSARSEGGR